MLSCLPLWWAIVPQYEPKEKPVDPLRVVVADDESIIRLDLKETLRKLGHDVVGEAGDGRRAVGLGRPLRPDLGGVDIKMPEMDGVDAPEGNADEKNAPGLPGNAVNQL